MRVFLRPSASEGWSWRRIRSRTSKPGRGSCEGGGSLLEHSQLRGCHEPETAIRKQTSLIEPGAVNLVTGASAGFASSASWCSGKLFRPSVDPFNLLNHSRLAHSFPRRPFVFFLNDSRTLEEQLKSHAAAGLLRRV